MTDRHHAGEDADIPDLEEIHEDIDPGETGVLTGPDDLSADSLEAIQ